MKKRNTYQFTKYFIYILLIVQLWSNVFSYVNFCNHNTDDLIELTSTESENENKVDSKKELEDKIVVELNNFDLYFNPLVDSFLIKDEFLLLNHFEINLPPPEPLITS